MDKHYQYQIRLIYYVLFLSSRPELYFELFVSFCTGKISGLHWGYLHLPDWVTVLHCTKIHLDETCKKWGDFLTRGEWKAFFFFLQHQELHQNHYIPNRVRLFPKSQWNIQPWGVEVSAVRSSLWLMRQVRDLPLLLFWWGLLIWLTLKLHSPQRRRGL